MINANTKTYRSIDPDTLCPRVEHFKALIESGVKLEDIPESERPCGYCYVEYHRGVGDLVAKLIHEDIPYIPSNVLKMRQTTIDKLNSCGGIRVFSNTDYKRKWYDRLKQCFDDCHKVGLKVKAITKRPEFIEDFAHHPAVSVIHISIDCLGYGVDWNTALQLREQYSNVLIRSVVTSNDDIPALMAIGCDIYTFNHGRTGYVNYRPDMVESVSKAYGINDSTCCASGNCLTCPLKCGVERVAS